MHRWVTKFFTTLAVSLTSVSAVHAQSTPIDELEFADSQLAACVDESAESYRANTAEELTTLYCNGFEVTDLDGIEQLSGLTYIRLTGGGSDSQLVNIQGLSALNNLSRIFLSDYGNSTQSLRAFDLSGHDYQDLYFNKFSGIDNSIWDWFSDVSSVENLSVVNSPLTAGPSADQVVGLGNLSLFNADNIDPNVLIDTLASHPTITGLDFSPAVLNNGSISEFSDVLYQTSSWTLPDTLTRLNLFYGRVDSMQSYLNLIERSNGDFAELGLGFYADDWSGLTQLTTLAPNLEQLSLWLSNLDDYQLLTGFTGLNWLDLESTKATNGEHLVTVLENNPQVNLWMGWSSTALYCDDLAAIKEADRGNQFAGHDAVERVSACRTDQYTYQLTGPEGAGDAVRAYTSGDTTNAAGFLTEQPNELELEVLANYQDSWGQPEIQVQFASGETASFHLRHDQPKSQSMRVSDINFADAELEACANNMLTHPFNTLGNGSLPEFAHELNYMVCDAPDYYVTDLSGLEHFTQLTHVQMRGEDETITNVSPLLALNNLQWLTLINKNIATNTAAVLTDFRSIQPYWQNLNLTGNQLSDPHLFDDWFINTPTILYLADNNFSVIPEVAYGVEGGLQLAVGSNPLNNLPEQIERLGAESQVSVLSIDLVGMNQLSDISFPSTLTGLSMAYNHISSLQGLQVPDSLQHLSVIGNPLDDVTPALAIDGLRSLAAGDTNVDNLAWLANATGLEYIDLEGTDINDLSPLASLNRGQDLELILNRIPATDWGPAQQLGWLDLEAKGNAHVACAEFEAIENSTTAIRWNVCNPGDGTIRYNQNDAEYEQAQLADDSKRWGKLVETSNGFEFIPHPGIEGWVTFTVKLTDANGNVYYETLRVYIEPGSNPAQGSGIPIAILVPEKDKDS